MTLTVKQKRILDYVESYSALNGYAPTISEICSEFSLSSVATAHKHLKRIEEKGYLRRMPHQSRALEVLHRSSDGVTSAENLPLLGFIAAGEPVEAITQPETISIPSEMLGRGVNYALRVKGDSMIDEQIRDGDYVIVQKRDTAENGQVIVALINGGEVTLKKYYREGASIRLQPSNPNMKPIYVGEEDIEIQGVVIGVLRKY